MSYCQKILRSSVLLIVAFASPFASASLLELRAGFSVLQAKPDEINENNGASFPQFEKMDGFSADAVATLPAMPIGLGVRFERFNAEGSNSAGSFDAKFERTSLLVSKRLVDTGLYFGGVLTIGLTNQLNHEQTVSGTRTSYKATSGATASAGVEGGLKLGFLRVGAEAGYLYAPLGKLKYSNGTDVINVDGSKIAVDLNGPYARVNLGFGF